jgi:hypothetical protein
MTCPSAMSAVSEQVHGLETLGQPIEMERRSKERYALVLNVRYRALGPKLQSGDGQVVNLSSSGALVVSQHEFGVGEKLEVSIEWPSLLNGGIPLQLVAVGSVVRCGRSSFAVSFHRYQFRTLRSRVQPISSSVFRKPPWRLPRRKVKPALP